MDNQDSVIALLALGVSAASAWFAWQSNQLKAENISVSVRPNPRCPAVIDQDCKCTILLCWDVLISNRSENKTSIINYFVSETASFMESAKGVGTASKDDINLLPYDIDGGAAKKFSTRTKLYLSSDASGAMKKIFKQPGTRKSSMSISQIESELRKLGMDLYDNRVHNDALYVYNSPTYYLQVITGKGQVFLSEFEWWDHGDYPIRPF